MDLKLVIPGPPVPKGRPRVTRRGITYTPKKTKDATERVRAAIAEITDEAEPDSSSRFGVSCKFYLRLKGYGADVDNLLKLILDACNVLVWKDDRQVFKLIGEKVEYADEPRTEITIWTRGNDA